MRSRRNLKASVPSTRADVNGVIRNRVQGVNNNSEHE